MAYQEWDTEEVLAFVYDVIPWRDMDAPSKVLWCKRVRYLITNITTDGRRWTQGRAGKALGVSQSVVSERLAWSERFLASDPDKASGVVSPGPRSSTKQTIDARRAIRNPDISPQAKAEIVAEAIADPAVARQVVADREANLKLAKARQEHDTEARAFHEARDPELKDARTASELATVKHELARLRNLGFTSVGKASEWTDDGELVELIDEMVAAWQAVKDALNFDTELANLIEGGS